MKPRLFHGLDGRKICFFSVEINLILVICYTPDSLHLITIRLRRRNLRITRRNFSISAATVEGLYLLFRSLYVVYLYVWYCAMNYSFNFGIHLWNSVNLVLWYMFLLEFLLTGLNFHINKSTMVFYRRDLSSVTQI